jgi:hypothetical protein
MYKYYYERNYGRGESGIIAIPALLLAYEIAIFVAITKTSVINTDVSLFTVFLVDMAFYSYN